jgi:hypothetical protein
MTMNAEARPYAGVLATDDLAADRGTIAVTATLKETTPRLCVRDRRRLGRADAVIGGQRWGAKHYWTEGEGDARQVVYEFDQALPPGAVTLVIPVEPG